MDLINLCTAANILQASVNNFPYPSNSEESLNILRYNNFAYQECGSNSASDEDLCHLPCSSSTESLGMLLNNLPDIVKPDSVFNPLPLQCLAANSLPESIRREIDKLLEFSKSPCHISHQQHESSKAANLACVIGMKELSTSSKATLRTRTKDASCRETDCRNGGGSALENKEVEQKSVEDGKADIDTRTKEVSCKDMGTGSKELCKEPDCRNGAGSEMEKNEVEEKIAREEKADIVKSPDREPVFLHQIVVKREYQLTENIHDLGVGFKVIGGVKCSSCNNLHTVITSILADDANPALREGSSIKVWAGKNLEGSTFEEVSIFLKGFAASNCDMVELLVKVCRGKLLSKPGSLEIDGKRIGTLLSLKSFRRRSRVPRVLLPCVSSKLDPPILDKSQSSSQEVTEKHKSLPCSSSTLPYSSVNQLRSTNSLPRSASPSPTPENVEVSIPRLDSNAKVLLAKPLSPISSEDGHFNRFPNGMIQVSLTYDNELEDLQVVLWKAKGQSNQEIGDTNDVFINTYLIPDLREQGVRSIVNKPLGSADQITGSGKINTEESHSYNIRRNELEECAIRIILWDATKSKKVIFRGEVLLSLSDKNVIYLTGQPTWFTVCPVDPNLPALPKPVYPRQLRNKDHILSKIVHKAQALAHLTTGSMKTSTSVSGGFPELSNRELGKRIAGTTRIRKTKQDQYDPHFLRMIYGDVGSPFNSHTINEAKLAKLSSIINVLRESGMNGELGGSEEGGKSGSSNARDFSPILPEFTNIFKTDVQLLEKKKQEDVARRRKHKKSQKLPKTVLHALCEGLVDNQHLSDSSDILDDDTSPINSLNGQSTAYVRDRVNVDTSNGTDCFQISSMRQSLNAGKRNRVSNYNFESLPAVQSVAQTAIDVDNVDIDKCEAAKEQQMHYKLIDTKSLAEEDEVRMKAPTSSRPFSMPASSSSNDKVASPDCKCYPVPVEVSVHHICVVDVDREKKLAKAENRSRSMNNRSSLLGLEGSGGKSTMPDRLPTKSAGTENEYKESAVVLLRPPSGRNKLRSRSVGDMECLSSDEEVLLVRTPVAGHSNQQNSELTQEQSDGTGNRFETVDSLTEVSPEESGATSSLDINIIQTRTSKYSPMPSSTSLSSVNVLRRVKQKGPRQAFSVMRMENDRGGARESWMLGVGQPREGEPLVKCCSMSNLTDAVSSQKSSSKNNWRQNYLLGPQISTSSVRDSLGNHEPETTANGSGTVTGSAKLQLEYNDLNPQCPVLLVKLLDILLQSSKNLSSELLIRCQLMHTSTKVCILKNKTLVNIKNPLPSAPLGILQFQTDITNLSLEIMFLSLGKLFSTKKVIGHVFLDLNSLHLSRDSTYWRWLPIVA